MIRFGTLLLCLAAPAVLSAQPAWQSAARVDVTLSNFKYAPRALRLRAGQPVVLRLVNTAWGGHNFTAREFFGAAAVRPQDRGAIADGNVELRGGQSRDIALVPRAGRYKVKCTHTFHTMLGMTGEILVD